MRISRSKSIPHEQLDALFKAVGWRERGKRKWKKVLSRTDHAVSVWDGEKLVGFGRIFHDGVFCYWHDIAVHSDYRRKGVGTRIMTALEEKVAGKGFAGIYLQRWLKKRYNRPFYIERGWVKERGAMKLPRHMTPE